tara:strand:- start:189 stop:809 length:621 start_codon:yes stop_codon:yes gene_type:complete
MLNNSDYSVYTIPLINNNNCIIDKKKKEIISENKEKFSIIEKDEFYIPDNKYEEEQYVFINDIKQHLNNNNYPDFNLILNLYFKKLKLNLQNLNSYFFIYILLLLYLLLLFIIFFGWLLPSKLLSYYIVLCILYLLSLENKTHDSIYNNIIKYLFNQDICILPFNYKIVKNIILFLIVISFFSLFNNNFNFFTLLKNIILSLDKYN